MENLRTRILIQYEEGKTIAYLYNRESFDLLEIERQEWDKSQFIEVGQKIKYDGMEYKVKSINFKMEADYYEADNEMGINLYSPTDVSGYNCQIGVFVE